MLDFVNVALKNVFHKPITRDYPRVKRTPFKNQRGHIENHIDDCIFCGMCMRKCPVGAIKVDRVKRTWSIDHFQCVCCSYCAESCPKKCIEVKPEYSAASYKKDVEVLKGKPIAKPVITPEMAKKIAAAKAAKAAKAAANPNIKAVPQVKKVEEETAEPQKKVVNGTPESTVTVSAVKPPVSVESKPEA